MIVEKILKALSSLIVSSLFLLTIYLIGVVTSQALRRRIRIVWGE